MTHQTTTYETPADQQTAEALQLFSTTQAIATVRAVAEGCMALTGIQEPTKVTEGAFSVLLRNQDSPYGSTYPEGHIDREKAYLKSLGYPTNTVAHAIRSAHDSDPKYHHYWDFPSFGIMARKAHVSSADRRWARTASITIEKPAYARRAIEKGWGIFADKYMGAALLLILKTTEITPEDLEAIQANLDRWE